MKAPLTISIVIMEELEKNPRRMTVEDVEILAVKTFLLEHFGEMGDEVPAGNLKTFNETGDIAVVEIRLILHPSEGKYLDILNQFPYVAIANDVKAKVMSDVSKALDEMVQDGLLARSNNINGIGLYRTLKEKMATNLCSYSFGLWLQPHLRHIGQIPDE